MEQIFINDDNLLSSDIEEEATRVKGLLINSNDEILLGYSYNCYQFPGGHMEGEEPICDVLKREVKEETGIELDVSNVEPFLLSIYYKKNYFKTGKNRCNKIYYLVIKTNELPNLNNTSYTKEEKIGNYELRYVNLKDIKEVLKENENKFPVSKDITREMLIALEYYFEKECS